MPKYTSDQSNRMYELLMELEKKDQCPCCGMNKFVQKDTMHHILDCDLNNLLADHNKFAILLSKAPEMYKMLQDLEFEGLAEIDHEFYPSCPICGCGDEGHKPNCKLGNLLAEVRDE